MLGLKAVQTAPSTGPRLSGQRLVQHLLDLALDHAAHGRQQQAELELDTHRILTDSNAAVGTAALEFQGVAVPAITHVVLAGQALGQTLGLFAGAVATEGMRSFDTNAGHDNSLNWQRAARLRHEVTSLYQPTARPGTQARQRLQCKIGRASSRERDKITV